MTNTLEQVKDKLDKIFISTEVIQNLNKLTSDKLDQIRELDYSLPHSEFLLKLNEITRYSDSYMTLNYIMNEELEKINNNVKSMCDEINNIIKKDIKSE